MVDIIYVVDWSAVHLLAVNSSVVDLLHVDCSLAVDYFAVDS